MKKMLSITLVLISLVGVAGCSDSESANISVTLISPEPQVQIAPFQFPLPDHTPENPSLKDVAAPWFRLSYIITNNSTKNLTISGFSLEVEARTENGIQTSNFISDLTDYSTNQNLLVPFLAGNGGRFEENITWLFGGLPEMNGYRYRGRIKFIGYFLKEDDPNTEEDEAGLPGGRFEKLVTFTTR